MKSITYNSAVKKMAREAWTVAGLDLFSASSVLAVLFNKSKKQTADDLMKERTKMPHWK